MQFCCTPRRWQLFLCIISSAAIVAVLIILFLANWPSFAKKKLIEATTFKNGSMELERFRTTADLANLRLEIYVYNVTNVQEVIVSSAKIKVQQLGPFVYHEYKTKEFIDNNQTSGLIAYKLRNQYTFRPELSVGDPKKLKVNWINVPLLVARAYLDRLNFIEKWAAYAIFNQWIRLDNEPAFMTDSIDNLIFSGSERKLYEDLQKIAGKYIKPWPLPDNKFAILYNRNNTWLPGRDYVFTVSTGFGQSQTYRDLNQYVYMNGSKTLPFWSTTRSQCNKLSGTDGEFFSPFLNKSDNLEAYSSDICRKISLKYRDNVYIDGISAYRYTLDERSLESRKKNPENDCYCLARDDDEASIAECDLDGLIDLSSCVSPNVVASGRNFLYGSPELRKRIPGLPPVNISLDEISLHVEPNTGIPIQVKIPIQLNVRLEKDGFDIFGWFKEDKPLIVPLMSVIEAAEMTSDQASVLRNKLLMLDSWFVSMVLGGTIIFILAIVATAIVVCIKFRRPSRQDPNESDPLIPSGDSTNSDQNDQSEPQHRSTYQTI